MNYDLCDLLNRKLEAFCRYIPSEVSNRSIAKNQDLIDKYFEEIAPEFYIETLDHLSVDHQSFNHWVYRNGKISDQVPDYESSARKVTKELANLSYSNNAAIDIMYFSGVMKLIFAKNKCMYLECCIRPTLDQMLLIKDFERQILKENGKVIWRIIERRGKNQYHCGVGLDSLHGFKWSRIK
jgi:hypothetical protein